LQLAWSNDTVLLQGREDSLPRYHPACGHGRRSCRAARLRGWV